VKSFLVLPDSSQGATLRLVFGMAFGVGCCPLREHFHSCLGLLALGMLL
jgi:hypothetical protein